MAVKNYLSLFYTTSIIIIIVLGEKHEESKFDKYLAYAISAKYNDKFPCPGVILNDKHILTTASCVSRKSNLTVMIGDSPMRNKTGHFRIVSHVNIHPDFMSKRVSIYGVQNSLAILTLAREIPLNDKIAKVELPTRNVTVKEVVRVSGWIGTCLLSTIRRVIHRNLTIADPKQCPDLRPDEFCVDKNAATKKIHYGSPVMKNNVILGFTTFACSSRDRAVTNVFAYVDFIKKIINT